MEAMNFKKKKILDEIIRVNHAGEFGAQQIYSGQIKFTKEPELKETLNQIAEEEDVHLSYFEDLMIKKRVRPTLMSPLWKLGGFSLGAFTAILGKDYVMACTEAVETIIVDHYKSQIGQIEEVEIQKKIEKFLNDEAEHQMTGMTQIKKNDFKLKVFKKFIKVITKIAIKVSKKI